VAEIKRYLKIETKVYKEDKDFFSNVLVFLGLFKKQSTMFKIEPLQRKNIKVLKYNEYK